MVSLSESTSDSDEVRSTKLMFTSSLSTTIRCFLRSGEHMAEEVRRATFEQVFSLVSEATWLTLQGRSCSFDPGDVIEGASARSLKGISLTTTMSSSSSLLLFAGPGLGRGDPTPNGSSSDADGDEISDAGDADRDEMIGDEGAELL